MYGHLCACDLATHGHWFVDIRCANILSFFPSPLLALAAFFYVIVIMAFFCSHLYWAEYVSDRNCNILIHRKLIFNYELFINLFHAEFDEFYNRKWPILFQTSW